MVARLHPPLEGRVGSLPFDRVGHSPPRLDDDLGVRFRIGEVGEGLRDAVDADAGR